MLVRQPWSVCWVLVAILAPALAHGQSSPERRAIQEPTRLTAGASNQWMGVLHARQDALYFVSDRNATAEIFVQQPVDAGPRLLFDSNADVAWPRPSPDGQHLAFVLYQADATGDLCVRHLASGDQRCLTSLRTSEMQPVWMDGGKRLAALMRTSLHSDYQLRRFDLDGELGAGDVLVERNMLGAAVSPDSRWLAYVPLDRTREQVGVSFANRSGDGLRLQRLDGSAEPIRFMPDLPGLTGFPVFSTDGRQLFFAQYLNDTNGDGSIDGNDHSIIFRVPFAPDAANPIADTWPEQLTSAQWNCRYPAPAADQLIVTCAHQGSLDIYSLPLTGAVPSEWNRDRIRGELRIARNHWNKLLLLARLLSLVTKPAEQIEIVRQMVLLHVELREYESAVFYSEQIRRLAGASHPSAAAWAELMLALTQHRREDVRLTHGQLSDQYVTSEQQRATQLAGLAANKDADVSALAHLVLSEVQADIGHKDRAERSFAQVDTKQITDPLVLAVYAQQAEAIHGLRGARAALLEVYRNLAVHPALDTLDRLRYAEQFVTELQRGVPVKERPALVAGWLERLPPESELALMLQVAGWLLQLDEERQEQVRAGIFELYKQNKDIDRRRALVLATVRAASKLGNEYLQYQFATSWASWLRRSEPERKYAEVLYRQVVLERAYTHLSKNEIVEARAAFYAATVQAISLEAHIGFIEARFREGHTDLEATYAKRYAGEPDSPVYAFVSAYLLARKLPSIADADDMAETAEQALSHVKRAAATWPRNMEIRHVWGTVLHQRAIRTGSREDALAAHSHYLLALDLARSNVRFRAVLQQQLGLLQAAMGNHRIALQHFRQRDRLPHVRAEGELNLSLAMARSWFHIGRHADAVSQAQRALALVEAHPDLARYRPLVLDRLALYHQSAGEHARALDRYRALLPLVDAADASDIGAPINRIKARLGVVAAALGAERYALALEQGRQVEALLAAGGQLRPSKPQPQILPVDRVRFGRVDYDMLLAGLLAQAHRGMDNLAAATEAMERRQGLLAKRFAQTDTHQDLLELARTCYHLAEYAFRQKAYDKARQYLEQGLGYSQSYNTRTESGVNPVGLRLLQAYAELHLYGGVSLDSYALDLQKQLAVAYEFICKYPSPTWEADRFLFGLYLSMLKIAA